MANERLVIAVEHTGDFDSMDEVEGTYTAEEILEMINRYCATQRQAKKYRTNAAANNKLIKAKYEAAVKAGLIKAE